MNYQTYPPSVKLESFIKCHWSLEVPAGMHPQKQRIVPDGCMEMIFILGDNIRRYTSDNDFIIQPRAVIVGQLSRPFVIEPTGYVHCFATRFYPYGLANFMTTPLKELENKETPIAELFDPVASRALEQRIVLANTNAERIEAVQEFFLDKLNEQSTIDHIIKGTIDVLLSTNGSTPIKTIVDNEQAGRRQLERKFLRQVGLSPKQLGKVIRLQAALKLLLNRRHENLTEIAYQSDYYDQAHFIRDFKDFTGINPSDFLKDEEMLLSSVFYTSD
ncbi:helix-turn-helix domain-containing protein [Parachryseolinea silvisoli]|uniref:helix-turn-helix domain-containing protein n=1 Tax=Parachryseolinea silvisoli TaxID=2873601 RepID=UPI002265C1FB|nr:helix-turn-helix domain-containing protein [Parachryseolinea silvisoli]MCD9020104.1 helix-turn-helix domain-containing protein [Parachryseolinea silvisoli]